MKGQKKYSKEKLHCVLHMDEYLKEIQAGGVSQYRRLQLKERFADVKQLSYQMYSDAYKLIMDCDGEQTGYTEMLWKKDLEDYTKNESKSSIEYTKKSLHPVRHLQKYVEEIKDPKTTYERLKDIKERLAKVREISIKLYYDASKVLYSLD